MRYDYAIYRYKILGTLICLVDLKIKNVDLDFSENPKIVGTNSRTFRRVSARWLGGRRADGRSDEEWP